MNTNLYFLCISKEYCMIPLLHVVYMYSQAPKCAPTNNNTAALMKVFTSCKLFSLQRLLGTVFCEKDISKVFESVANNLLPLLRIRDVLSCICNKGKCSLALAQFYNNYIAIN